MRRISRFYRNIQEPTLFIRYINCDEKDEEGKVYELTWIENNYQMIIDVIKKYNSKNNIIFIANSNVVSETVKIYHVKKDQNDVVARRPFEKNKELQSFFESVEIEEKEENFCKYKSKMKRKNNYFVRQYRRAEKFVKKKLLGEYIHCKQEDFNGH